MKRTFSFFILTACGVALVACSQDESGGHPIPGPCPALAAQGPALYSPSPGATGVPTAAGTLSLFNDNTLTLNVSLVSSSGTSLSLGVMSTPAPGAGARTLYYNFAYPQLASATTYTVQYADASQTSCPLAISPGGSFTTQ